MVKPKVFLPQEWVTPVDRGYSIMLYDIPATKSVGNTNPTKKGD
jgi:hypothetical protein